MPLSTVTAPVKTEASKASILPVTSPVADGNDEISQRHRLGSAALVAEEERSSEVPSLLAPSSTAARPPEVTRKTTTCTPDMRQLRFYFQTSGPETGG